MRSREEQERLVEMMEEGRRVEQEGERARSVGSEETESLEEGIAKLGFGSEKGCA